MQNLPLSLKISVEDRIIPKGCKSTGSLVVGRGTADHYSHSVWAQIPLTRETCRFVYGS